MTHDDNSQTGLNYELLVEDALRSVVRSSLRIIENIGLPGETHFYISFISCINNFLISNRTTWLYYNFNTCFN